MNGPTKMGPFSHALESFSEMHNIFPLYLLKKEIVHDIICHGRDFRYEQI